VLNKAKTNGIYFKLGSTLGVSYISLR